MIVTKVWFVRGMETCIVREVVCGYSVCDSSGYVGWVYCGGDLHVYLPQDVSFTH